jgi:hypothetical protein
MVMIPPKLSILDFAERLKRQTSIKVLKGFRSYGKSIIEAIISGQRVIVLIPLALMPR